MELLPPPVSSTQQGVLPGWVLPAAVLLSGGDAASSLIDPSMPLMLAAGKGGGSRWPAQGKAKQAVQDGSWNSQMG
eukprot:scaffold306224_cov15-Tisochrysis_lutea.AAC.1